MPDGRLIALTGLTTLSATKYAFGCASVGKFTYAFGGLTTSSTNVIEGFSVNPSTGELTALTEEPNLSAGKQSISCASVGNYIYVMGGYTTAATNVIEGFSVNPSTGELTALTEEPNLSAAKFATGCASVGNYIYVMGGYNGTNRYDVIEGFSVNSSTGALTALTGEPTLSVAKHAISCASVGKFIYAFGGSASTGIVDTIEGFSVNPSTGELTALTGEPVLSVAKYGVSCASVGNYIYVMGGYTTAATNVIEGFSVNPSTGELTALTEEPVLSVAKYYTGCASVGNYIYVMGGYNGTNRYDVIEGFKVTLPTGSGVSVGTSPMMIGM